MKDAQRCLPSGLDNQIILNGAALARPLTAFIGVKLALCFPHEDLTSLVKVRAIVCGMKSVQLGVKVPARKNV